MDCIIVGGGVAGFQAAATCRTLWPDKAVTVVDTEKECGYYRTLLPQYMAGSLPEEKLFLPRSQGDPLLKIRCGVRVKALDRKAKRLKLTNGETLGYDRLILAQGGDPLLPGPLAGPPCKGIFPVRALTAARAAREWLASHRQVIVFGGSLVGVKTALHLGHAGFEVSLVVRRGHILLRALSPDSARVVEAHLAKRGVRLYVNAPLEELRIAHGAIAGLKAGGQWIVGNTLLVAAGTNPDTSFLEGTGLLKDGRIVVSPSLQTSDPLIFAAGDAAVIAAAHDDNFSPNTWPQAVSQGKQAAANLYRKTPLPYRDFTRVNAMELHGLAMVILGPPVDGADVLVHERPEESIRRELFLKAGKPVGGALIGDITAAGTLRALIQAGETIDNRGMALLAPESRRLIPFPESPGRREALILPNTRYSYDHSRG
jgi:NADPH-dependent 2,4-dienoyl-CoA reductase/sulfur reductase-like enzyme